MKRLLSLLRMGNVRCFRVGDVTEGSGRVTIERGIELLGVKT